MDGIGVAILIMIVIGIFAISIRVCTAMWWQYSKENNSNTSGVQRRVVRRIRIEPANAAANSTTTITNTTAEADRQGNIFTIANEAPNNTLPHRCSDFFYVDPAAEDAARIRAQLEKDEKDLPTYDQVMAMSVAQTAAGTLAPYTASNTSIATTDTTVPPYSDVDRSVIHPASTVNVTSSAIALQTLNDGAIVRPFGNTTTATGAASTSRAASAAATSTPATVVTIANSVSNTSV